MKLLTMKIYFLLNLLVSSVYSMDKNKEHKIIQLIINKTREHRFNNPDEEKLKFKKFLIENDFLEENQRGWNQVQKIQIIERACNEIFYHINDESQIRKILEKIMGIESNQNKP